MEWRVVRRWLRVESGRAGIAAGRVAWQIEKVLAGAATAMIMLDTHIAVALAEGRSGGLQGATRRALDREPASISPAVLLELELLHEIGRLRAGGEAIATHLRDQLDIRVAGERFADVARMALAFAFTRDPFDRLIVAHAALLKARLVTHDAMLQHHYAGALG